MKKDYVRIRSLLFRITPAFLVLIGVLMSGCREVNYTPLQLCTEEKEDFTVVQIADIEISEENNYPLFDESQMSIDERIEFIKGTTGFVHNIIVGTPIEKIQGNTEILPYANESSDFIVTDYYFKVLNWAFGVPGEQIIIVSSQVGNVFEIGEEYMFAAIRLNSVFYDIHMVVSSSWIINNKEISDVELNDFLDAIGEIPVTLTPQDVIEEATPSEEFIINIDVGVIATVTYIHRRNDDFDNLSAELNLLEVVYGEVSYNAFDEFIRLRGDVTIGFTYLFLFSANELGHLRLLARNGAIIPSNTPEFYQFIELFK